MADLNIQMKQRNGTLWDSIFPITKSDIIVESETKKFVSQTEKDAWNAKQNELGFTPENSANKGTANGYASLGADGKIPTTQIPALAITDTHTASSQTAQLALSVQKGDICVRTDLNKSYINLTGNNTAMTDWQELLSPTSAVTSVNGETGAVTLTASEVGAEPAFAKNTAFNKNFETATSNIKMNGTVAVGTSANVARADHVHPTDTTRAPLASPALTGTPTAPTATSGTNTTQIATTAFVKTSVDTRAKITVNATEPSSPSSGDFWYEITA